MWRRQVFQQNEAQVSFELEEKFTAFVQSKFKPLGLNSPPTYSEFQMWYSDGNGREFDSSQIDETVPAQIGRASCRERV